MRPPTLIIAGMAVLRAGMAVPIRHGRSDPGRSDPSRHGRTERTIGPCNRPGHRPGNQPNIRAEPAW